MKKINEGPFDSKSSMNSNVRKAFGVVNKLLKIVWSDQGDNKADTTEAFQIIKSLSDKDKKALLDIVKSIVLLTSANVKTVRSYGETFEPKMAKPWATVASTNANHLMDLLYFDSNQKITKEDYKRAAHHLEQLGKETHIQKLDDKEYPDRDKGQKNYDDISILYRGFKNIPGEAVAYWLSTTIISLPSACSSSTMLPTARNFARQTKNSAGSCGVVFIMKNPKKIGLDARKFSRYSNEFEIIVKGSFKPETLYVTNTNKHKDLKNSSYLTMDLTAFGDERREELLDMAKEDIRLIPLRFDKKLQVINPASQSARAKAGKSDFETVEDISKYGEYPIFYIEGTLT
jgi:hypothetical protein